MFIFLLVWAGGHVCFAVWAGVGGGWACFFLAVWACVVSFCVWAGDGSSLTYWSAWLPGSSLRDPTTKKDQTATKKKNMTKP